MNELITLTLHKDYLRLFRFLKDNPTKLERNGDYYRLTYWLRLGQVIALYTATTKRHDLTSVFLEELNRF